MVVAVERHRKKGTGRLRRDRKVHEITFLNLGTAAVKGRPVIIRKSGGPPAM